MNRTITTTTDLDSIVDGTLNVTIEIVEDGATKKGAITMRYRNGWEPTDESVDFLLHGMGVDRAIIKDVLQAARDHIAGAKN